jgi:hypothetical protein
MEYIKGRPETIMIKIELSIGLDVAEDFFQSKTNHVAQKLIDSKI